jgi:hypothetical protein
MNTSYSKIRHIQEVNQRLEKSLIREQDTSFLNKLVDSLTQSGYKVVDKISLPDGEYDLSGSGYVCYLNKDNKDTGFVYVTTGGIRGMWDNQTVNVVGGKIQKLIYGEVYKMLNNESISNAMNVNLPKVSGTTQTQKSTTQTLINKIATEGIKNVTPEMVSEPPFDGQYSGYEFGGIFNNVNYEWDCHGVEGMSGIRGIAKGTIQTENVDNLVQKMEKPIQDAKPNSLYVGFYSPNSKFIIYTTVSNKPKCMYF